MKTNLILTLGVFVLLLSSCGPKQFYEKTENGLEYYFFTKNKEAKLGQIGDIYNLNITATTKKDSILFSEHAMFKRHESIYAGDFHEGLSMLHEGDSVAFILSTDSFFGMHNLRIPKGLENEESFKLLIGVEAVLNPLDHMIYKSELELVKMKEYVRLKAWDAITDTTGIIYEIVENQPNNELFELGSLVAIAYTFSTMDGRIIEKTRDNDVWEFVIGGDQTPFSGLTRLLVLMRHGETVRALLPFAEAYGEAGNGPLRPPYTTIVVDLKAQRVNYK